MHRLPNIRSLDGGRVCGECGGWEGGQRRMIQWDFLGWEEGGAGGGGVLGTSPRQD